MKTFFTFSIAAAATLSLSADTLTLRADEWCPYNCDPKSDKPGFMIEIAKEVFGKAGHTIDYQTLPWSRTLMEVAEGKFTAAVGAGATDITERKLIAPKEAQGISGNVFFAKKESTWKYEGIPSLEKIKLGVINNYSYGEAFDKYIAASKDKAGAVQVVSGDTALEINFKKLDAGRVDAIIEDKSVGLLKASTLGLGDKIKIAGEDTPTPVFIAFSAANPKAQEYADLLSKGTEELRKSGKLKEILAKYGVSDWK